ACEEGLIVEVFHIDLGGDFAGLPYEMHKWYGDFHAAVSSYGDGAGVAYLIPTLKIEAVVSSKWLVFARPTLAEAELG
ncbi:hypothetical protein AAVH_41771, partial [Aphelenchoides avenae]